ncbi:MAG: RuvX/YqgF family protein, partial [Actinomycetaceae bacterium]
TSLAGLLAGAGVPVRLVDERLTTTSAHRAMHASGRAGRRHREVVDQVAAVLILETALDLERSTGRPPGRPVTPRTPKESRA